MAEKEATPEVDHDHHDGCLCGHDAPEQPATGDHELPAAAGGVAGDHKPRRPRAPAAAKTEGDA